MRRTVKMLLVLAVGAMLLAAPSTPTTAADYEKELVFAFWGGRWEAGLKEALVGFEAEYGVKISWVAGSSVENLAKVQAQRARPQIDVLIIDDIPARQGKNLGVWAKLDDSVVTNRAKLYDLARFPDNEGVGLGTLAFGLVYNTKTFAERGWPRPTSWNDLYRPEHKGRVVSLAMTTTSGLQTFLMLNRLSGGTERNTEPGWKRMAELADRVVTFPRISPVFSQHFERGDAWIGTWDNAAAGHLANTGFPIGFVVPKEGAPVDVISLHVVKDAPHPKVAQILVNYMLGEKTQSVLATKLLVGPLNREVKLDPESAARVVYGPEQIEKLIVPDLDYVAEQRPAWIERWTKEIGAR